MSFVIEHSKRCTHLKGLLNILEPERALLQCGAALLQLHAAALALLDELLLRMRHLARSNAALLPPAQSDLPTQEQRK